MFLRKKKWPQTISLELNKQIIDVVLRIHPRAKNYRLSIASNGNPVLSAPPYAKLSEAKDFLFRHRGWLENRLNAQPKHVPFVDGASIKFRGEKYILISLEKLRGQVEISTFEQNQVLLVPGGKDFMARRLSDWLKKQARLDLEKAVKFHAENLEVFPKSITIRSQSSRWGSCSSSGRLNFNWRLILAPNFVLDYVAAHEVAHLIEMNHSSAFWAQVELTLPDMERGRIWLKKNGQELMSYG